MRRRFFTFAAVVALVLGAVGIANAIMPDFGSQRDHLLDAQAQAASGCTARACGLVNDVGHTAQAAADPPHW